LRVAVAAYLARYKELSRYHTESDLRVLLRWCADRGLDPLALRQVDVELFVRWLQEVRRFKPSTVSRRLSVLTCFYRTCVMDAILDSSPAAVPAIVIHRQEVRPMNAVSAVGTPCSPRSRD
jgi:integrase/recombinase XerD